jgi:hypothetical protein
VTEKGKNKFDGEGTYSMMEESPSRTLQVDRRREEIIGESSGLSPSRGGKNK